MPEPAKCRQWLEKNFPNEFARLTMGKYPPSWAILFFYHSLYIIIIIIIIMTTYILFLQHTYSSKRPMNTVFCLKKKKTLYVECLTHVNCGMHISLCIIQIDCVAHAFCGVA